MNSNSTSKFYLTFGHSLIFALLFLFNPIISAQVDCPPFHITATPNACLDIDFEEVCDNLNTSFYRTINGTFNNLQQTNKGKADGPIRRRQQQAFYDQDGSSLIDRGNPRMISNMVVNQPTSLPNNQGLSSLVFTFLQFIDHDITLVEVSGDEMEPIIVPQGDPYFDPFSTGNQVIPFRRSHYVEGTGTSINNPRQHTNLLTAWLDGSVVYGSDLQRAMWLRSGDCGKLKASSSKYGELLPYNTLTGEFDAPIDPDAPFMDGNQAPNGELQKVFVAGDLRANEQVGLTSLHTLFAREHNRICEELINQGNCDDEQNYQYVRKIVGGQIQAILYNELLPIMGIHLPNYQYKPQKSPNIFTEFATAAYRLGHTMVTNEVPLLDANCSPLADAPATFELKDVFFNPTILAEYGPDVFLRGLESQLQEELDAKIVGSIRNFLFGAPGSGGLDLAALNIQRGRDHGLPSYNQARTLFGLDKVQNFSQITSDPGTKNTMIAAYGNVDKVDLWIGALAEDHLPGKIVGPTLHKILRLQFKNIRDADRFYYLNDPILSSAEKWFIHETTLADIINRNTSVSTSKNAFFAKDCYQTSAYCQAKGASTYYEWIQKVKFNAFSFSSGNDNGYGDYTHEVISLQKNYPNILKLIPGYSGKKYREYWRVWIDLNKDGDFDDSGEIVFQAFKKNKAFGAIWLDETVSGGYTKMRIAMSFDAFPESCGDFDFGEVEDYSVFIAPSDGNQRIIEGDWHADIDPIAPVDQMKIFPNPAIGRTTLSFTAFNDGLGQLSISNTLGQIILNEGITSRKGENLIEINVAQFKPGIYFIQLNLDGQKGKTLRLMVSEDE